MTDEEKRELETFTELSKDKAYPCQHCKRLMKPNCQQMRCGFWREWFGSEWRRVKKTFSKNH